MLEKNYSVQVVILVLNTVYTPTVYQYLFCYLIFSLKDSKTVVLVMNGPYNGIRSNSEVQEEIFYPYDDERNVNGFT